MPGNASNIRASQAYVTIRADQGNLPQVIDAARKRVQDFSGSVSMLGEKIVGKFGSAVTGGLVGFAAIGAIDAGLKEIAALFEKWRSGEEQSGWEFGAKLGEAVLEGWMSVPVFGTISKLSGLASDELFGAPMAIERHLDAVAKQREALTAVQNSIGEATDQLNAQVANFGNTPGLERNGMEEQVAGFVNQLVKQGYSLRFAREASESIVESFQRLMTLRADDAFGSINQQLQEMAGRVPQDTKELQRFEQQLESLAQTLKAAGRANEVDELTGALRQEFEWIRIVKEAEKDAKALDDYMNQRQESISKIIENLRDSFLNAGLDDNIKVRFDLSRLGANKQQIAEVQRLLKMLDEFKQFEKDADEVSGIINDLQKEVDTGTLGERGMLERRLRDLQATEDQITTALSLFDQTALSQIESSFIGSFSPAALEGGLGLGGLEDSSRETARNTRRMVQALERNQLTYGS